MTDSTDPPAVDSTEDDAAEGTHEPRTPDEADMSDTTTTDTEDTEPDTFPREVVEQLRQENGKYRQRAQPADVFAPRLHTELVKGDRQIGRSDRPRVRRATTSTTPTPSRPRSTTCWPASRTWPAVNRSVTSDKGNRGSSSEPFSLLGLLKERT